MAEKKKYNYMENVLQEINKNCISLSDEEVRQNNVILEKVVSTVIQCMKKKDKLFESLYGRVFYGGSYYDGLRVGKPEEFDLDLLLRLPKIAQPTLTISNQPGFVHLQLKEFDKFLKQPEAGTNYRKLIDLLDDKRFLITSKVSAWMEGVVTSALNDFNKDDQGFIVPINGKTFHVKVHKGGPAFTLKLSGPNINIDIDLVPCFVFAEDKWPIGGYRPNPVPAKPEFFIVPKNPKVADNGRYWRLSFQEQERVLINNNRTLKPAIKLLKRLRDVQNHHPIASYYIKTVFLWEVQEGDKSLWDNSLSFVVMQMLNKYKEKIESEKIPYFWNKNNNLIGALSSATLTGIKNNLSNIIDDIDKHPQDPFVIAKYLVDIEECNLLKEKVVLSKKILKQMQNLQVSEASNYNIGNNGSETKEDQKYKRTDGVIGVEIIYSQESKSICSDAQPYENCKPKPETSDKLDDCLKEICNIVRTVVTPKDEFSIFGDYVATQLRKISDARTLSVAKHTITTALFEAENSEYKLQQPDSILATNLSTSFSCTDSKLKDNPNNSDLLCNTSNQSSEEGAITMNSNCIINDFLIIDESNDFISEQLL